MKQHEKVREPLTGASILWSCGAPCSTLWTTQASSTVEVENPHIGLHLSLPLSPRYIQAATSPKDIIIVVDISGSMKGLKMTIAKHTINTILDTLGENDFVNVIAVSQPSSCH